MWSRWWTSSSGPPTSACASLCATMVSCPVVWITSRVSLLMIPSRLPYQPRHRLRAVCEREALRGPDAGAAIAGAYLLSLYLSIHPRHDSTRDPPLTNSIHSPSNTQIAARAEGSGMTFGARLMSQRLGLLPPHLQQPPPQQPQLAPVPSPHLSAEQQHQQLMAFTTLDSSLSSLTQPVRGNGIDESNNGWRQQYVAPSYPYSTQPPS